MGQRLKIAGYGSASLLLSALFAAYWFSVCDSKLFAVLAVFGCLLVVGLVCLHQCGILDSGSRKLKYYGIVLLGSCIVFTFAFPPFSVPDEGHHFFSSYWLSDVIMGQASLFDGEKVPVRAEDIQFYHESTNEVGVKGYRDVVENFSLFAEPSGEMGLSDYGYSFGSENVFGKIGSVAGITIGRLMGLGAYPVFYLGRIASALFFAGCMILAVKITPVGKSMFAAVSLLPMTLHLAASYSYDSGIISYAFLLTAFLLKAIYGEGKLSHFDLVGIVLFGALLAPMKAVYFPILALVLFIPQDRFESRRFCILFKAGVFLAAFAALLFIRTASVAAAVSTVSTSSGSSLDHRGPETGHFYDVSDLLAKPIGAVTMFLRTFDVNGDFYLKSMLGGSLGWFQENIAMPFVYMLPALGVLLLAAQKDDEDAVQPSCMLRAAMASVAVVCSFLLLLSLTLIWTFDTEYVIQGVQGRYFLPVLPIALLALRSRMIQVSGDRFTFSVTAMAVINILLMMRLVALAII